MLSKLSKSYKEALARKKAIERWENEGGHLVLECKATGNCLPGNESDSSDRSHPEDTSEKHRSVAEFLGKLPTIELYPDGSTDKPDG